MSSNYGFEPTLDGLNNIDADSSTTTNIICDTITVNTSSSVPTRTAGDNTTNIANTAFVTDAISTAGASYMTLSTTQTATGQKTFSNPNTFISGNLVTNNIQSALATTDINIGQNLTTGDIFMGTTSSTNVALNWGSSSNGGNMTFRGGTFNFFATGLLYLRSGATFDTNIADNQTSGILNLGQSATRTGAINIGSLTTLNAPITIGSSASSTQTAAHHALTTFKKLVVVDDGILLRLGFSTTGLTLGKTNINEITAKLLNSSDTLYFNGSTGANIMYLNSTEIINTIQTTFSSTTTHTGTATFNGSSTFNNDILVQQSTYPSTNTSQLGYSKTETLAEFTFTADTFGTIGNFTVPSKGVWICNIICNYRTTGGAGSFENVRLILTIGSTDTTAYRTFEYFDETDVVVGTNGKRFVHTISGTLNTTTSQTFYIRGINDTTGITTFGEATYTYTRVG